MTREDAKKFVGTYGTFTKNQYDVQIDKIYDSFEKQTCSNCKHLENGIGCEIYPCAKTWLSTHEDEFGCNQFTKKE